MQYLKNVVTLRLNTTKCVGCGVCALVCPHAVFSVREGKAVIEQLDSCMECGACDLNCPTHAISVDSGVGCATAFIMSAFTGGEPNCDCAKGGC